MREHRLAEPSRLALSAAAHQSVGEVFAALDSTENGLTAAQAALRRDPGEHGGDGNGSRQAIVVETVEVSAREHSRNHEADVAADLRRRPSRCRP